LPNCAWKKSRTSKRAFGLRTWPEELANAVVFLAPEAASYVTGQTFLVDGGQTLGL
jgi:NAD(P)-dependent dehydrogenase (short-subunit alcohol dehydrogenase family)